MSAGVTVVDRHDRLADPLCARLDAMLSEWANAVAVCAELRDVGEVSDAERIDRIARLERLKAAAAGLQAARTATWNAAGPSGRIAGLGCGRRRTPWPS